MEELATPAPLAPERSGGPASPEFILAGCTRSLRVRLEIHWQGRLETRRATRYLSPEQAAVSRATNLALPPALKAEQFKKKIINLARAGCLGFKQSGFYLLPLFALMSPCLCRPRIQRCVPKMKFSSRGVMRVDCCCVGWSSPCVGGKAGVSRWVFHLMPMSMSVWVRFRQVMGLFQRSPSSPNARAVGLDGIGVT